jgi:hypothetical protein
MRPFFVEQNRTRVVNEAHWLQRKPLGGKGRFAAERNRFPAGC